MIVDACLFAGETEMLELRFRTLKDVVDRFVVVACARTHQGQPLDRQPIEDAFLAAGEASGARAVIYWVEPSLTLVVKSGTYERAPDERGPAGSRWFAHIEKQHRNGIEDAVRTFTSHPGTIVMMSDVDEIPNPAAVRKLDSYFAGKQSMSAHEIHRRHVPSDWVVFEQRFHSTALDLMHPQGIWWGTCVSTLGDLDPQGHRNARATIDGPNPECVLVRDAGVHFSWCGSDQERQRKIETFSHAELLHEDPAAWRRDGVHSDGQPLRRITLVESYEMDWPVPILDGSWAVPDGWLTQDAWSADGDERPAR